MLAVYQNYPLLTFNTFGLDAYADLIIPLKNEQELSSLNSYVVAKPYKVIGGGSNVVFSAQVATLIILNQLKGIELIQETPDHYLVKVAAGENWHHFVSYCLKQHWYGLENLALIPGTVGASPVQNIGAYGVEVKSFIHSVQTYDPRTGQSQSFTNEQCQFDYRDSVFKHEGDSLIITSVQFLLPKVYKPNIDYPDLHKNKRLFHNRHITAQDVFDTVCEVRKAKLPDPAKIGNVGSFFKNPIVSNDQFQALNLKYPTMPAYTAGENRMKIAAAWLIDEAGWKGKTMGKVAVHDRQALVMVNRGGATARDVQALATAIQDSVFQKFGIHLEPEPVFIQ